MKAPNGLLAQVSTAHLISHLHIMAVPAMLPLLPNAMQVSFVELGIALGVFNIVSAVVQAPLGFLVDRAGARRMLLAALSLGSLSFALLAAFPTYFCLLVAMGLAGLANGVYHPADYSLLSQGVASERMGRAFSIHTFAGFLGAALAPPIMVGVALASGPRWSFAVAAMTGLIGLCIVAIGSHQPEKAKRTMTSRLNTAEARPLTTPGGTLAVLTLLFAMLSLSTGAIEKFSVSALVQGFEVPLETANLALTVFMFSSALGVLAGGILADRTAKHGYVAAGAFALAAVFVMIVIGVPLSPPLLALALGAIGFLTGIVAPSRDMLVRAASPAGAEGKTFGIVSTGFNVGGVAGPILFGFLLDRGLASGVLWASVGFMVITTVIVLAQERNIAPKPALAAR
ncbi:TPA: MFS transporter [Stenotrophomonas maltophilia]|uniref:MFS transporter n=1 Tax=Cupriavidus pauculus TaxID=82633 RepID=UPI000782B229|nr:MFS transporter [Cupriavidus pauculus]HDS1530735.1 MFS transporter [Stenotrophomonas maltophilia]